MIYANLFRKHLWILATILCLFSCQENKKIATVEIIPSKKIKNKVYASVDTVVKNAHKIDTVFNIDSFIQGFPKKESNTIILDSLFINNEFEGENFEIAEVNALSTSFTKKRGFKNQSWVLEDYLVLDNQNIEDSANRLTSELSPLDPHESHLKKLFAKMLKDSTLLLFWSAMAQQRDVCPYFHRQSIGMTIIYKNKIKESLIVAFHHIAGDPPLEAEWERYATVSSKGKIMMKEKNMEDDNNEDKLARFTFNEYALSVSKGSLSVKKMKLGKEQRMKRNIYE
jgi:hypothetical protein